MPLHNCSFAILIDCKYLTCRVCDVQPPKELHPQGRTAALEGRFAFNFSAVFLNFL